MPGEVLQYNPESAEAKPKRFGLVLPGALSTTPGMSALQTEATRRYGEGNAKVYNAALLGGEPLAVDKYAGIASLLEKKLASGMDVDVFLLSMGAGEFAQVAKELSMPANELAEKYKDKLHFTLISPTLPKSRREALRYIKNYAKVGVQEAVELPRPFPTETRILRGINGLASIPPEDFDEHGEQYVQAVRRVGNSLSHAGEASEARPFEPDADRNYMNLLDTKTREKVNAIDQELLEATYAGNDTTFGKLMQRRVRYVRPVMRGVYAGTYADQVGDTPNVVPDGKSTPEGRRAKRKLIADTFWRTTVFDSLSQFADAGFDMKLILPEYDILMNKEDADRFANGRPNVTVEVAEMTTHGFPWGARPEQTYNAAHRKA